MSDTLLARLRARDVTLWPPANVATTRLGWLDLPARMRDEAAGLMRWADSIERTRVVLIGMGGSSLGPEVLRAAAGRDDFVVLDTTDPATIASVELDGAFFVVSSKSGGTLEVRTILAHCWARVPDPSRYLAITDHGTDLASLANERGFARTFLNPPDIGGRYSVLSYFGLVPAALLGYDLAALCDAALDVDGTDAVEFGEAIGSAARQGQDKLTIRVPEAFSAFGLWVEQLVAESTGKSGRGCVPVPTVDNEVGSDRFGVTVDIDDPIGLGAQFFRWELATAAAGHALEIDPFNEPNVAESKANTAKVLAELPLPSLPVRTPNELWSWLTKVTGDGDYVSLQAYLPYGAPTARELDALRRDVRDRLGGMAVTAGYGPRFLHSTGQLHKGGPPSVVAVQLVPRSASARLDIPGFEYDFGTLIAAQSIGDHESLVSHGRRVVRIALDDLAELG